MADDTDPVTLAPSTSRTLRAFAERIGQSPEALADEAIERFIAAEEPIAEKVLAAMEDVRAGRVRALEDVVDELTETIARAERKRA